MGGRYLKSYVCMEVEGRGKMLEFGRTNEKTKEKSNGRAVK